MPVAEAEAAKLLDALNLTPRRPPEFFRNLNELEVPREPIPQANAVRRVWKGMRGLDGVFYIDRSPAVYVKHVRNLTPANERDLQRCLWNQGIAPILIVGTPRHVHVYSGRAWPAKEDEDPHAGGRLVRILDLAADALEVHQLIHSIETGLIYEDKPRSFDREQAVDRYLLQNLSDLRKLLGKRPSPLAAKYVHGLLTRTTFTCYLIEREIAKGEHFDDPDLAQINRRGSLRELLCDKSPSRARELLYAIFEKLAGSFNGSMFDTNLAKEKKAVEDHHMEALQCFLRGDELAKGQQTLGFWAYDFSVIPIETISAIYEDFIEAAGPRQRRETGAYYTPPHLAELVVDTATEGWASLLDKKALDPACGSGMFLVSVFNRMAEEWRRENRGRRNTTRARDLSEILRCRLFGIDVQEEACRVACFSLYLALLDQLDPRDIIDLQAEGWRLPKLLLTREERRTVREPRSIVEGNVFELDLPLRGRQFDLVVGNPPWVSKEKSTDQCFLEWMKADPKVRAPQKQMAHGFMWQSPMFLTPRGRGCLVLPSAVLLNESTNEFQRAWFGSFLVDKVIQLADLSFLLFSGAARPAVILRFAAAPPASSDVRIDYLTPKTDPASQRGGGIAVSPEDLKYVRLAKLLSCAEEGRAPGMWKMRFWGTPRDIKLLQRLDEMPKIEALAGQAKKNMRWCKGQGIQPIGPDKNQIWWDKEMLFLDAKRADLGLLLLESDCEPVGDRFPEKIHRPRDSRLFQPPLVVVSQGFSKVAFSSFPLVFQHALQSIAGPEGDAGLLMFLTVVLRSELAIYFLFHTSANWGTERDKVHFSELLRMPFPLPEQTHDPAMAAEVVEAVQSKMAELRKQTSANSLEREALIAKSRNFFEERVRDYYDIDESEQMLVEDTVKIFEPSSTPGATSTRIKTLQEPNRGERERYVKLLCRAVNRWARRSERTVSGSVTCCPQAGAAVVTLSIAGLKSDYSDTQATDDFEEAIERIGRAMPQRTGSFVQMRGLKVFDGDQLHMLKPLQLRWWTRTAALNDADEIAAAILGRR